MLTLVTALYDLAKRGADQHRSVKWLLANSDYVMSLPHHLVVFTEPELVDEILRLRGNRPTKVYTDALETLVNDRRWKGIQQGQLQLNASPTKVTPEYVRLTWAKYAMLDEVLAITNGQPEPTHIGWIDIAIEHVGKEPPSVDVIFANPPDKPKVHVLRYFNKDSVGDPKQYWRHVYGELAGGLVIGGHHQMAQLVHDFWSAADLALSYGLAPQDEGLLSYVVAQNLNNYSFSYGDYEDILRNHDRQRGGEAHLRWQLEDAKQRGLLKLPPPLLGLVMIVKNEAHGIKATLDSFSPYIDNWTILDTGSTDGTQDIVRAALSGIPGKLMESPFVDFATSRNRALELHGEDSAFTIMPDSDDQLVGGTALRAELSSRLRPTGYNADAFLVNLRRGDLSYQLPLVLRAQAAWRYRGKVHEFVGPQTGHGIAQRVIAGVQVMQAHQPQSLEASRKRWKRDLDVLSEELTRDPKDPRALFYLAQTHECLGEPTLALLAYTRRVEVGGWAEETFEAKFRIAKIMEALKRPWPDVQQAYLDAHQLMPSRAEPLFKIAEHWHSENNHALAYLFAQRAARLPKPQTTLFIDEDVYAWKAADLVAIHAYYLSSTLAEGQEMAEKVVRAKPNDERMRANLAFYAPSAAAMFPGYTSKQLDFTPDGPYVATNPSIYFDVIGKCWSCIVRTTNYRIVNGQYLAPNDNVIHTRNFMLDLDNQFDVINATEITDETFIERSAFPVHGFEDCRLFKQDGIFYCTATVCDFTDDGKREIALLELGPDCEITSATALRGPWSDRHQKNWMPTVGLCDQQFVYALVPGPNRPPTVFTYFAFKGGYSIDDHNPETLNHGRLRGGSQLIRFGDGWLCIVHDVAFPGGASRIYLHRFAKLSIDFKIEGLSKPFFFEKKGIEFCAGLAYDGTRLVASFGVEDRLAYVGVFDPEAVQASLRSDFFV